MKKRTLPHLQSGLPWLLVGILLTILWQSQSAGASPPLKPLQVGPPPQMINYQGLVNVGAVPFDGTGFFKFAIVDRSGATRWSNDGTSANGSQPSNAVSLPVNNGLFNVLLGDTSLPNMTIPLGDSVFAETETFLRIWFNDGDIGFEQLRSDTRIASVAYALRAASVEWNGLANVPGDIADGDNDTLAGLSCTSDQIAKFDGLTWVCADSENAALDTRLAAVEDILTHFTTTDNDIFIDGANLHVRNGTDTTGGTTNSLGNVIIGYNELRDNDGGPGDHSDRTGSHMLVVGQKHNYSSYGGIVVGERNTTSGAFASVSGGRDNRAISTGSSVSGGAGSQANGAFASVSGGRNNRAIGVRSTVSGGQNNIAGTSPDCIGSGLHASVSGGDGNTACGTEASVSGGVNNTASANNASVSGGRNNIANSDHASVSGGGDADPGLSQRGLIVRLWEQMTGQQGVSLSMKVPILSSSTGPTYTCVTARARQVVRPTAWAM